MVRKILIIIGVVVVILFINNIRTSDTTVDPLENIESVEVVDEEVQVMQDEQNEIATFTSANVFIHVPEPEMLPSCEDHTFLVSKQVTFPATSAVLTASIEKLMEITEDSMDEQAQNWVSNERGFSLQSVSIENTIAKIYLTHQSLEPYTSPCQVTWMKFQFEATANQYPTVSATQVYVNGQLI